MAHFSPMTTLDKIIERYRIDDTDDGLGTIGWGGKLFYKKNSAVPILLSRTSGSFRLTDNNEAYELDNDYMPIEGETLDKYYPQPFFEDKRIRGFMIVKPLPNFKQNIIYLVQTGIQDNNYIASGVYNCIFLVRNCLEFPEFFEPVYH